MLVINEKPKDDLLKGERMGRIKGLSQIAVQWSTSGRRTVSLLAADLLCSLHTMIRFLTLNRILILGWTALSLSLGCSDRTPLVPADGLLMVNPSPIQFGPAALHGSKQIGVQIQNAGRAATTLGTFSIEGGNGQFSAGSSNSPMLIPGALTQVQLMFTPQAINNQSAFLVVQSDSRAEPTRKFPIVGLGVDAHATLLANALDFGKLEVLSVETQSLSLTNTSILPVTVSGAFTGVDAGDFDAQDITLAPGDTQSMVVHFHPQHVGVKKASMAVALCQGCGSLPVSLTAEALDRGLVAEPGRVDFGRMPVDQSKLGAVFLHNLSAIPITVSGFGFVAPSDPAFSPGKSIFPVTVAAGDRVAVELQFTPSHVGTFSGSGNFHLASLAHPELPIQTAGIGGDAEVCLGPAGYDFQNVPVGSRVSVTITLRNCGAANTAPLTVSAISFVGDPAQGADEFNLGPIPLPQTLTAGQQIVFKAFFEPTRVGGAIASLQLHTSANPPDLAFDYFGHAQQYPPCSIVLTPPNLDFGTIAPGLQAVLGFKVANKGGDLCAVKNIHLTNTGGGVFSLPGGVIEGLILNPNDAFTFQVRATLPSSVGQFTGSLSIGESNSATPVVNASLKASSAVSCLSITPKFLDFGQDRPDCPAAPKSLFVLNSCKTVLKLNNVTIGPGTTDGQFSFLDPQPGPFPYYFAGRGDSTVNVAYSGSVDGPNISPLFFQVEGLAEPLMVPLLGESSFKSTQIDTFTQQALNKLDVLFVSDNTPSMENVHAQLAQAVPAFVNALQANHVDSNIGVTTASLFPTPGSSCPGGGQGGENGRLFPVDNSAPRILHSDSPNLVLRLQSNLAVGECGSDDNEDNGLEAMRRALSPPLIDHASAPLSGYGSDGNLGFYRPDAALAVVVIGNEDDRSPDSTDNYVNFIRGLKGIRQPNRAKIFAISPTATDTCVAAGDTGTRYVEAATKSGGQSVSVCATDYSGLLTGIANQILVPQTQFSLTVTPKDSGQLSLTVDNIPTPSGWHYDSPSNSVIFDAAPSGGAVIQVSYLKACHPG